MPTVPLVPTVRRRRLGDALRRHRMTSGTGLEDAAAAMGWDRSKLSRIETAKGRIRPQDVTRLLAVYGITNPGDVTPLEELARDAGKQGWWQTYSGVMASSYADLISLETDADTVREWSPLLVPGLLQTAAYARETIAAHALTRTPEGINALVDVRITRQSVLATRSDRPPLKLWAVIGETALTQRFATRPETMREQIQRLIEKTEAPNVTVQIMPMASTPHPGGAGGFSLVGFQHPMPDVVHVENLKGSNYAEGNDDVTLFGDAFGRIAGSALSVDDSLALLKMMEKRNPA